MPWGWAGVDVFFVLSGFLITGILFDSRDDIHRVRNFYVRRTLRIFPLYYGVMLLLIPFVYRQLSWSWLVWPAYLGNYAGFVTPFAMGSPLERLANFAPLVQVGGLAKGQIYLGHFWSLCMEEQFYLVWPWMVFWIRDRRRLLWICAASLPVCVGARVAGQHLLPAWMLQGMVLYKATPFRLDALLLGGFMALWIRGPRASLLSRVARFALPLAIIAMAFMPRYLWQRGHPNPAWMFTWGLLAVDLLSALVIALAIQPKSLVYRALNHPPLRWLGRISYGAYLLHDIPHAFFFALAHKVFPAHAARIATPLGLISTCILAWLSYRFFESRFLNLKERWTIRG